MTIYLLTPGPEIKGIMAGRDLLQVLTCVNYSRDTSEMMIAKLTSLNVGFGFRLTKRFIHFEVTFIPTAWHSVIPLRCRMILSRVFVSSEQLTGTVVSGVIISLKSEPDHDKTA